MRILWFTWKDLTNPQAGGAEVMNEELARRLAKDGHEIILLVGGYEESKREEMVNGYKIIRVGNRYTVYWEAYRYYVKHLKGWANLIIEEINTIPFMTQWYAKEKKILLIYQLCREIWFYQFFFPLSIIGFLIEPIYLWLVRKNKVLTESESTKKDLLKYGFKAESVSIIPIGVDITKIESKGIKKYSNFTLLSVGTIRSMKRTIDQIKAFEFAKKEMPDLQMKIAGDAAGSYGNKTLETIKKSPFAKDIEYCGRVSKEKKIELISRSHLILGTSVKEGWGLVITEAAVSKVPAVVYNVDGLRDSVIDNKTGLITSHNTPIELSRKIVQIIKDKKLQTRLEENALLHAKSFTYERSFETFKKIIGINEK